MLAATAIFSAADMATTDFIDWEQLAFNNPTPLVVFSNLGVPATVDSTGGNVSRSVQGPGPFGNFTPGDFLIRMEPLPNLTIQFASPVAGVGTQWATNFAGPFGARLTAFDSADMLVGSVTRDGLAGGGADGSAIFLGLRSSSVNISRVLFTIDFSTLPNDIFFVNRVLLTSTPIPEPATWAMLIAGFGMIGCAARRRPAVA
ncbi:MAG: PEPxxWA-CTERM sorting domain-containing protein [Sphingomonadaceae bacterium]